MKAGRLLLGAQGCAGFIRSTQAKLEWDRSCLRGQITLTSVSAQCLEVDAFSEAVESTVLLPQGCA